MVTLEIMTREKCHELFRGWQNDPAVYEDPARFKPYVYSEQCVNEYFDSKQGRGRTLFVIMEDSEAAGELQLKRFDYEKSECAVGIHMKNDSFKGRGCGTRALELGAEYAFEVLNMKAVNADALITNARSRRALCKAGFGFVCEDGRFVYYRKER